MEIKKTKNTLFFMFLKQVIILAVLVLLAAAVFIIGFTIGMNARVILPANYTENVLKEKEEEIAKSEPFDASLLPHTCTYGIFNEKGEYQEGTLKKNTLKKAKYYIVHPEETESGFLIIDRQNGYFVAHYSISAQFANPVLYKLFPKLEFMILILFAIVLVVIVIGSALCFGKKLKQELAPLLYEIEQIKNKELEFTSDSSRIKEFNDILLALDDMKKELARSLTAEWEAEQRRKDNISALAHDIKTPLTIIKGNAELIKEEEDIKSIYEQTDIINKNADKMERYIKLLIAETKGNNQNTLKSTSRVSRITDVIEKQSRNLCKIKRLPICVKKQLTDGQVNVDVEAIQRAVLNLVINALEHTDAKKGIKLVLYYKDGYFQAEIEDFGNGFSKEAIHHAKEQFYTERAERSGEHYGLGMYFADCVAKKYNGEVTYYNKEDGLGAVVIFSVNFQ